MKRTMNCLKTLKATVERGNSFLWNMSIHYNEAKDYFSPFLVLWRAKSKRGQNSLGTTGRQINWLSDQEIDYQVLPALDLPFKTLLSMMLNWKPFRTFPTEEIVSYLSKTAKHCFQCIALQWCLVHFILVYIYHNFRINFVFVKKLRFFYAFYFCWRTQNFSLPPLTWNKRQLLCKPLRSGKKTKWDPSFLWS